MHDGRRGSVRLLVIQGTALQDKLNAIAESMPALLENRGESLSCVCLYFFLHFYAQSSLHFPEFEKYHSLKAASARFTSVSCSGL